MSKPCSRCGDDCSQYGSSKTVCMECTSFGVRIKYYEDNWGEGVSYKQASNILQIKSHKGIYYSKWKDSLAHFRVEGKAKCLLSKAGVISKARELRENHLRTKLAQRIIYDIMERTMMSDLQISKALGIERSQIMNKFLVVQGDSIHTDGVLSKAVERFPLIVASWKCEIFKEAQTDDDK